MPLRLNPTGSERPKELSWDPKDLHETLEIEAAIGVFVREGYTVKSLDKSLGVAVLTPPALDAFSFMFRVLSENGDDRLVWNRRSAAEVAEARKTFDEYLSKGYKAYVVRRCGGKPGAEVESFDELYEEVVMAKGKDALLVPPTVPG